MTGLIDAARAEGTLTTIGLPHDWCNYGEAIETFKTTYGLAVNEVNPNAGSADDVEAIKAAKDHPGPQAPDVIDVSQPYGPPAKADGLLQPYKVSTWDTIPLALKDADAAWWGDYYGVVSFETNTAAVPNPPQDWSDLLKAEYRGKIALAGDPRVSDEAIHAVYAAALANGGSLDAAQPGLAFFKKLNDAGNLLPGVATSASIVAGDTPIGIRWTYNALTNRDASSAQGGPEIDVTIPKSGRLAGLFVQGISAFAQHPNAAKLWQEFLFSDDGQNLWLKGYCHPTRYADLVARNAIPVDQLAKLPDVSGAVFPTHDQLAAASSTITKGWDATVGLDIH